MNININKVLAEKSASALSLDKMSPADTLETLGTLSGVSNDFVKSNFASICASPLGENFAHYYLNTSNISLKDLESLKESHVLDNNERLMETFNDVYNYRSSNEYKRTDIKYKLACMRYADTCVVESLYVDELDLIGYNINSSPETIDRYAKLLAKIEIDDYNKVCSSFPELMVRNTEIILGLRIRLTGRPAVYITSLPNIIAKRLTREGNRAQIKAFIPALDKSISMVRSQLKDIDSRQYDITTAYLDNLYTAKDALVRKVTDSIKESCSIEGIADMQPDVLMYEEGIIEDPMAFLEDALTDLIFDDNEDISMESIIPIARVANELNTNYIVTESGKIQRAANKFERKSQQLASKASARKTEIKRTTTAVKKGFEPFVNAVKQTLNKIGDMDKQERRDRIITGQLYRRIFKFISRGIFIIASASVAVTGVTGLVISCISVLVGLAIDVSIDKKVRYQIIRELESELEIVKEKIDDSRGDDNKQNKYQLMRIKKKLEADLARVKYQSRASRSKKDEI